MTDGKVSGMISLANVKELSEQEQADKMVEQVMTPINAAMTILPETSLIEQRRTRAVSAKSRKGEEVLPALQLQRINGPTWLGGHSCSSLL